jgi:hypothetical protein
VKRRIRNHTKFEEERGWKTPNGQKREKEPSKPGRRKGLCARTSGAIEAARKSGFKNY